MFVVGLPVFVDVSSNGNSQHDKGLRVQMGTVHRFDVYIYIPICTWQVKVEFLN